MKVSNFHLGDILSVTTGKMLSPSGMGGIYGILNYMTGDNLFTHQLPRACDRCAPHLRKQHPQLEGADVEGITEENYPTRMSILVHRYGEHLPVEPLPIGDYVHRDAIEEANEIFGKDKVITVTLEPK